MTFVVDTCDFQLNETYDVTSVVDKDEILIFEINHVSFSTMTKNTTIFCLDRVMKIQ